MVKVFRVKQILWEHLKSAYPLSCHELDESSDTTSV